MYLMSVLEIFGFAENLGRFAKNIATEFGLTIKPFA